MQNTIRIGDSELLDCVVASDPAFTLDGNIDLSSGRAWGCAGCALAHPEIWRQNWDQLSLKSLSGYNHLQNEFLLQGKKESPEIYSIGNDPLVHTTHKA